MLNAVSTIISKGVVFFIISLVILASAYTIFAEDSTQSGKRQEKVEQKIEKLQQKTAEKIENIKDKADARIQSLREKAASKEAALRAKLETFKDKKKAQIAERINTNLNKINEIITNNMKRHLEKMTKILEKLTKRVADGKPDIKNADLAKQAIASASAAIASASAAVDAQAEKDYTIEATSEATIKEDMRAMRRKLHTDLQGVRRLVIAAKQAVANAISVAKSGKMERGKEATESGE